MNATFNYSENYLSETPVVILVSIVRDITRTIRWWPGPRGVPIPTPDIPSISSQPTNTKSKYTSSKYISTVHLLLIVLASIFWWKSGGSRMRLPRVLIPHLIGKTNEKFGATCCNISFNSCIIDSYLSSLWCATLPIGLFHCRGIVWQCFPHRPCTLCVALRAHQRGEWLRAGTKPAVRYTEEWAPNTVKVMMFIKKTNRIHNKVRGNYISSCASNCNCLPAALCPTNPLFKFALYICEGINTDWPPTGKKRPTMLRNCVQKVSYHKTNHVIY